MSILNYSELQTAVANWLGRGDLTARIPEFITLAEADMRRNLRDKVTRGSLALAADVVALPATINSLRSIRYNTATKKYPLVLVTIANLAALRRSGSGVPYYYAIENANILLDITPDSSYTTEIVYFEDLTPLSVSNTSNSTLLNSPDIYLFGALKEAAPYLEHDERNPMWSAKYQKCVAEENQSREEAELGGAPLAPKLPTVFG